jgi:hypothetical protein
MGKPPSHTIFKKVVKDYFRRTLPKNINETTMAFSRLNQCWSTFGYGSDQCRDLENEYDLTLKYDSMFQRFIKG